MVVINRMGSLMIEIIRLIALFLSNLGKMVRMLKKVRMGDWELNSMLGVIGDVLGLPVG